jgi:hypothetical protein
VLLATTSLGNIDSYDGVLQLFPNVRRLALVGWSYFDGSTDATSDFLRKLTASMPRLRELNLREETHTLTPEIVHHLFVESALVHLAFDWKLPVESFVALVAALSYPGGQCQLVSLGLPRSIVPYLI